MSSEQQVGLGAVIVNRMDFGPPPLVLFPHSRVMRALGWIMIGVCAPLAFGLASDQQLAAAIMPGALFVIGVVFMMAGSIVLARRASMRYGLTVHERGVLVAHKGSEQSIPYTQVQDFSLEEKEPLTALQGIRVGILRTMSFAWPSGSCRIVHFADASAEDAFGAVVGQIQSQLADVVQAKLRTGAPLAGKGWTLDSHGLQVAGQAPVRLGELAGFGTYEDKISFWRAGEELPFLSVPKASPNALLLGMMVQRQSSGREWPTVGSLGRVLFQKGASVGARVTYWTVTALCLVAGGGLLILVPKEPGIAICLAGVPGGLALIFAIGASNRLRVHELGVTGRSLFGSQMLHYSEVRSFQFGVERRYNKGSYAGTGISLRFTPAPGAKAITFSEKVYGEDADLNLLCEQVSSIVAAQLLERLKRGEEVSWGPEARFTQEGLVVHASKMFGKGERRLVPYDAGLRSSIDRGTCYLFTGNEPKAVMKVECAADNFYPGLKVLQALLASNSVEPRSSTRDDPSRRNFAGTSSRA